MDVSERYCSSQEEYFSFPDGACSHIHDWLVPLWARLVLLVPFRRIREVVDERDGADWEVLAEEVTSSKL
jgi:hypothetical protein